MAYILKNVQGNVIAVSPTENLGIGWQFVQDNDKEYTLFLESQVAKSDLFRESDIGLARVLEDLIDVLIAHNLITFSDLPKEAQNRLIGRQKLRKKTQLSNLVDDSTDVL